MSTRAETRVLVVDDDPAIREVIRLRLEERGYVVDVASDAASAQDRCDAFRPDAVISDVVLPDRSGVELLEEMRGSHGRRPVILITAHGTIDLAVEAMKGGATDFLTKPLDHDHLHSILAAALSDRRRPASASAGEGGDLSELVGSSEAMEEVRRLIREVAATEASVLITGESGTGKELAAHAIHRLSTRSDGEFVAINAAAIPKDLLESELFGHERGAFTGATSRRKGCFELAHGGTLLLDEIAEMPPALQPKLLRVLEDGRVRRIGGSEERRYDVRVLAATNREPEEAIEEDRLREDLFYRLAVFTLEMPPLRRHPDDLADLAEHFLATASRRYGLELDGFSDDALTLFRNHAWPGNVRELRNAVERAVILAKQGTIEPSHLPPHLRDRGRAEAIDIQFPPGTTLAEAEKALILETLEHTGHNKTEAARQLGVTARTIYNKLKSWGMQ